LNLPGIDTDRERHPGAGRGASNTPPDAQKALIGPTVRAREWA